MTETYRPDGQERALIQGLKEQREEAYETLIRQHGGRLLQVARRFVGEEEARDAVQESFLAAFKAISRFDAKARLSTWLHRIVVNSCLMRLRKKGRDLEQSIEPLLPTFLEDGHRAQVGAQWPPNPLEDLERHEKQRLVRRSIDRLPTSYRMVILLRDIEGLSGKETGDLLGITTNAVKVRLHRARQALREILDRQLREKAA